jgi:glycerophosphoryl diester phosphodiesterase
MPIRPYSRNLEVIAHRGLHLEHRENTIEAFEAAVAAGADAIELDVHASRDGDLLVHHDPSIPSAAGSPVSIAEGSTADLRSAARALNFTIPTLDEVLQRFAGRAKVYIEVKAQDIELLVSRAVRTSQAEIAVHSFDHRIVRKIRDFVPGIQTGVLTVGRPVRPAHLLADAIATDYWPQTDFVDADLVSDVHAAGGRVVVWTANRPGEWERLARLNVDAICTDRPDQLREWNTPH